MVKADQKKRVRKVTKLKSLQVLEIIPNPEKPDEIISIKTDRKATFKVKLPDGWLLIPPSEVGVEKSE